MNDTSLNDTIVSPDPREIAVKAVYTAQPQVALHKWIEKDREGRQYVYDEFERERFAFHEGRHASAAAIRALPLEAFGAPQPSEAVKRLAEAVRERDALKAENERLAKEVDACHTVYAAECSVGLKMKAERDAARAALADLSTRFKMSDAGSGVVRLTWHAPSALVMPATAAAIDAATNNKE